MGCVLDESSTDEAEGRRKVAIGNKFVGAIRSLVNAMGLQLKCARIMHEALFVPVLMYGGEKLV